MHCTGEACVDVLRDELPAKFIGCYTDSRCIVS